MIDLVLKIFAHALSDKLTGRIEETRPEITDVDYSDPESILFAANRLDQNGEWPRAVAMYEAVEAHWPDEHGDYARNCIKAIRDKADKA